MHVSTRASDAMRCHDSLTFLDFPHVIVIFTSVFFLFSFLNIIINPLSLCDGDGDGSSPPSFTDLGIDELFS